MKKQDRRIINAAIAQLNPFLLREEDGRLKVFKNAKECYAATLRALYETFPLGYIDMPYFMMKFQGTTATEANNLCRTRQYAYVRLYETGNVQRTQKLRNVLQVLLKVSGTLFDEAHFGDALSAFDNMLVNGDYAKYGINKLNNLNVIHYDGR